MAIITRSIDSNKTTICHIEKPAAYSGTGRLEGDGGLPQSRQIEDSHVQELGARARKILLEKVELTS